MAKVVGLGETRSAVFWTITLCNHLLLGLGLLSKLNQFHIFGFKLFCWWRDATCSIYHLIVKNISFLVLSYSAVHTMFLKWADCDYFVPFWLFLMVLNAHLYVKAGCWAFRSQLKADNNKFRCLSKTDMIVCHIFNSLLHG